MSKINAFFARQFGGGGSSAASGALSGSSAAPANQGGNATADGGGGGGDGWGVGSAPVFGVLLSGAAETYDPEIDTSRFGNPQVSFLGVARGAGHGCGGEENWDGVTTEVVLEVVCGGQGYM